jgi:hypothetical protein
MNRSTELSNFQKRCHEYYTCFTFATLGLQNTANQFRYQINENPKQSLFIGSGHPNENKTQSQIRLKDAVMYSEKDGLFSDILAKSIIVTIYTEWDEVYRPKIAAEVETETKNVMCDLMGDLRFIRHCLIHKKSIVDKNCTKFKILTWSLYADQELKVSEEMFAEFIDCINTMVVKINQ